MAIPHALAPRTLLTLILATLASATTLTLELSPGDPTSCLSDPGPAQPRTALLGCRVNDTIAITAAPGSAFPEPEVVVFVGTALCQGVLVTATNLTCTLPRLYGTALVQVLQEGRIVSAPLFVTIACPSILIPCEDCLSPACVCPGGTVTHTDTLMVNEEATGESVCVPCPYGALCIANDLHAPVSSAQAGFAYDAVDDRFSPCFQPRVCPGTSGTSPEAGEASQGGPCAEGYAGPLCSHCAFGHHRRDGFLLRCAACPSPAVGILRIVGCSLVLGVSLLALSLHKDRRTCALLRTTVSTLQTLAIVGTLGRSLDPLSYVFAFVLSMLGGTLQVSGLQCLTPSLHIRLLYPVILLILPLGLAVALSLSCSAKDLRQSETLEHFANSLSKASPKESASHTPPDTPPMSSSPPQAHTRLRERTPQPREHTPPPRHQADPSKPSCRRVFLKLWSVTVFLLYPALVWSALSLLHCQPVSEEKDSQWLLLADTTIKCWDGSHVAMIVAVVLPLLLLAQSWVPILHGATAQDNDTFLLLGYSQRKRWVFVWEAVVFLRKFALMAVHVFGVLNPDMQMLWAGLVLSLASLLQVLVCPYSTRLLNQAECVGMLHAMLVLLLSQANSDAEVVVLASGLSALNLAIPVMAFLGLVTMQLIGNFSKVAVEPADTVLEQFSSTLSKSKPGHQASLSHSLTHRTRHSVGCEDNEAEESVSRFGRAGLATLGVSNVGMSTGVPVSSALLSGPATSRTASGASKLASQEEEVIVIELAGQVVANPAFQDFGDDSEDEEEEMAQGIIGEERINESPSKTASASNNTTEGIQLPTDFKRATTLPTTLRSSSDPNHPATRPYARAQQSSITNSPSSRTKYSITLESPQQHPRPGIFSQQSPQGPQQDSSNRLLALHGTAANSSGSLWNLYRDIDESDHELYRYWRMADDNNKSRRGLVTQGSQPLLRIAPSERLLPNIGEIHNLGQSTRAALEMSTRNIGDAGDIPPGEPPSPALPPLYPLHRMGGGQLAVDARASVTAAEAAGDEDREAREQAVSAVRTADVQLMALQRIPDMARLTLEALSFTHMLQQVPTDAKGEPDPKSLKTVKARRAELRAMAREVLEVEAFDRIGEMTPDQLGLLVDEWETSQPTHDPVSCSSPGFVEANLALEGRDEPPEKKTRRRGATYAYGGRGSLRSYSPLSKKRLLGAGINMRRYG